MNRSLHFEPALTPEGWAAQRAGTQSRGRCHRVRRANARGRGRRRAASRYRPSRRSPTCTPRLPARAWPASPSGAAQAADSFWTWREMMYRFALAVTPDDVEASPRRPMSRCWRRASPPVAEFHYLHHDARRRALCQPGRDGRADRRGRSETGIGLTLLPVALSRGGFGGAPPTRDSGASSTTRDRFRTLLAALARASCRAPGRARGRRAALAARGRAEDAARGRWPSSPTGRSTFTSPSR